MKTLMALWAGLTLALTCALPASAREEVFATTLTGSAEVPANASTGHGTALVTVDTDSFSMRVQASFADLLSNTTASHIHCCLPSATGNAGVATTVPTFTGFPLNVTSGTYDHTFDMTLASSYNPAFVSAQGSISNAFSALLAGMETGNAYLNIHTTLFPGGEIRGLLAPVPEPSTVALMGIGLAAVGVAARRRRAAS